MSNDILTNLSYCRSQWAHYIVNRNQYLSRKALHLEGKTVLTTEKDTEEAGNDELFASTKCCLTDDCLLWRRLQVNTDETQPC